MSRTITASRNDVERIKSLVQRLHIHSFNGVEALTNMIVEARIEQDIESREAVRREDVEAALKKPEIGVR